MSDNLQVMLLAMLGSEDLAQKWWGSPNKAFDDLRPYDVYYTDPEKVYNYVLGHYQK